MWNTGAAGGGFTSYATAVVASALLSLIYFIEILKLKTLSLILASYTKGCYHPASPTMLHLLLSFVSLYLA